MKQQLEVCGGFDGSENDDWTAIRLETHAGWQFTPTYGPDDRPTVWNPAEWPEHRIPRSEVDVAWAELADRYKLVRVYLDPGFNDANEQTSWKTEIETWANLYGEDVFVSWQMSGSRRRVQVHAALLRFVADLQNASLTHDGCPITAAHMANARKIAKKDDRYVLGKPAQHQKIDLAVTSVLCHEAAADARAAGWKPETRKRMVVRR